MGDGGHLLWLDLVEGVEVAQEGACSEREVEPGPVSQARASGDVTRVDVLRKICVPRGPRSADACYLRAAAGWSGAQAHLREKHELLRIMRRVLRRHDHLQGASCTRRE